MNMSQELKIEWLPKLRTRYQNRNREGKSRMLDELCADYDYERKYAIKLLRGTVAVPSGRPCSAARWITPFTQFTQLSFENAGDRALR